MYSVLCGWRMEVIDRLGRLEGEVIGNKLLLVGFSRDWCVWVVEELVGLMGIDGGLLNGFEEGDLDRLGAIIGCMLRRVSFVVKHYGMIWIGGRRYSVWEMLHRCYAMVEVSLRDRRMGYYVR